VTVQTTPPRAELSEDELQLLGSFLASMSELPAGCDLQGAALRSIAELFDARRTCLLAVDPESTTVLVRSAGGASAPGPAPSPEEAAAAQLAVGSGVPARYRAERRESAGACVPLPSPGLALALSRAAEISEDDLRLLQLLAGQLALAVGESRHLEQLARLSEHRLGLAGLRTTGEVYEAALDCLTGLVEAEAVAVAEFHAGSARVVAQRGLDPIATGKFRASVRQLPGAREALRTGKPYRTNDIRQEAQQSRIRNGTLRATLGAPVVVEGEPVSMLYALRRVAAPFGDNDAHLIAVLAGQVGATLANRRLLDHAQRRRETAETVRRFAESLAELTNQSALLDCCCQAMLELAGADRVLVLLLDTDHQHLVPASCIGAGAGAHLARLAAALPRVPLKSTSSLGEALASGQPVTRRFGVKHPSEAGAVYRELNDASWYYAQPLITRGEPVGVAMLEWLDQSAPAPDQLSADSLSQVAGLSASSLRQAGLLAELQQERQQLRALHDVSVSIVQSSDETSLLERIIDSVFSLTGADAAWITLVDDAGANGRVAMLKGSAHVSAGEVHPLDQGATGWAIAHGRPVWISDRAAGVADPPEAADWLRERGVGSAVCVPLLGRGGRTLGALAVQHGTAYALPRSSQDILERLAAEAAVAVENAREVAVREQLEAKLRRQAFHDQLTGLPNRAMLLDRLERCIRAEGAQGHSAVLYLDLDRFKTVNDSLGHASGDVLLGAVAGRLATLLRPADLLARLGGDEFVMLLERLPDPEQAVRVAGRLLDCLTEPVLVGGAEIHVGASIGVAVYDGSQSAQDLIGQADIAMYQAKAAGRGEFAVYEAPMGRRAGQRLSLENDLRRAIAGGGLDVHFQPIIDLRSGYVVALEALSRWIHPERGRVDPEEFIAVAEDTGLIEGLDASVLAVAAAQVHELQLRHARPDLRLNVNLSASRLHRPGAAAQLAEVIASTGLPAAQITLEITETAVMRDPGRVLDSLDRFRELGLRLVVDDFGTGYSNLSYLKRLPLAGLKIDRSFVSRLESAGPDHAIVRAVTTMGHALGLVVTAEGVETEGQMAILRGFGCELAQGYRFSPARPAQDVGGMLAGPLIEPFAGATGSGT
jgi:diguanylate cyclase (GGDEF)-like protein